MSGGKREQHAGERRVPGAGKAASARLAAAFAFFATVAAAILALMSGRLFFSCGSRTLRRLPTSSSIDPMSTPAPGDAAAGDAAAGLELAGEDALAADAAAAAFWARRSRSYWALAAAWRR